MEPTFHEGDNLFVSSLPYWFKNPSPEDAVVLLHPFQKNKKILKRIVENLDDKRYRVVGDNQITSEDSNSFGPITKNQIVGKVLFRY